VSFYQHIAAMLVDPFVCHPSCVRMWGPLPATRYPHISIAVPPVITANPDITFAGSYRPGFDNGGGGSDFHHNVGTECARGQKQPKCRTKQ